MPKSLETDRLCLRRWRQDDFKPFAELNSDPRVMEFFPSLLTEAETQSMIERIELKFDQNGYGFWAVELKATQEFIGFVGLSAPNFETDFTPCVEVGWRLAFSAWGNGYAQEAARAALKFGFETLNLSEIVSFTAVENKRSRRVMERIGMSYDSGADFDHPKLIEGHPLRRHVLYRIKRGHLP